MSMRSLFFISPQQCVCVGLADSCGGSQSVQDQLTALEHHIFDSGSVSKVIKLSSNRLSHSHTRTSHSYTHTRCALLVAGRASGHQPAHEGDACGAQPIRKLISNFVGKNVGNVGS